MTDHDTQDTTDTDTETGDESPSTTDEQSLYDDALDTWGLQVQVDQSIEECAELIVALEGDDREAVIDELADVQLMVDQLAIAFDENAVDERVAEKKERLRERIDDARAYTDGGQPVDSERAESSVTTYRIHDEPVVETTDAEAAQAARELGYTVEEVTDA